MLMTKALLHLLGDSRAFKCHLEWRVNDWSSLTATQLWWPPTDQWITHWPCSLFFIAKVPFLCPFFVVEKGIHITKLTDCRRGNYAYFRPWVSWLDNTLFIYVGGFNATVLIRCPFSLIPFFTLKEMVVLVAFALFFFWYVYTLSWESFIFDEPIKQSFGWRFLYNIANWFLLFSLASRLAISLFFRFCDLLTSFVFFL